MTLSEIKQALLFTNECCKVDADITMVIGRHSFAEEQLLLVMRFHKKIECDKLFCVKFFVVWS